MPVRSFKFQLDEEVAALKAHLMSICTASWIWHGLPCFLIILCFFSIFFSHFNGFHFNGEKLSGEKGNRYLRPINGVLSGEKGNGYLKLSGEKGKEMGI